MKFDISELQNGTIKNVQEDSDSPGEFIGLYLIGTIQSLTPSGKIYAPWTTNQTEEDIEADGEFWEDLESSLPSGYFVHLYGDCVFIARLIDVETRDLCSAVFLDQETQDKFIETYNLSPAYIWGLRDMHAAYLDKTYPEIKLGAMTFLPSAVVTSDRNYRDISYREWLSTEIRDGRIVEMGGDLFTVNN